MTSESARGAGLRAQVALRKSGGSLRGKRRLLMAVWVCLVASVVVLSLLPASMAPEELVDDRLEHGLAYLVLAVIPVAAFERRGTALAAALGLIPLGILLEVLQRQIPGRAFEWKDIESNSLGVMAGMLVGLALRLRSTTHTEAACAQVNQPSRGERALQNPEMAGHPAAANVRPRGLTSQRG